MPEKIMNFVAVIIFSVATGYGLVSFIKGKFPAIGRFQRVVWGNKNVNPNLLVGIRARVLSLFFIIFFTICISAIFSINNIIINSLYSNLISIIIGFTISALLYRFSLKLSGSA